MDSTGPHLTPRLTTKRRTAVLAVMCLALMMVVAAVASLNVALPDLARDTGATQSQLQWIVDAYALVFAGLLLPAGALGDRFGRKGVLLAGLVRLRRRVARARCSWTTRRLLIGLRALMGVGAALVMPTTLSIITNVFPADERGQRRRDLGRHRRRRRDHRPAALGAAARVVLVAVGVRAERGARRAGARRHARRRAHVARARAAPRLDPIGALLSSVGLFGARLRDHRGPQRGWLDPVAVAGFVAGAALLVAFVLFELRRDEPMLDPRLFARRGFGVGSMSLTLQFFAQFGFLFIALQYLQFVLGYSALQAGLSILPMALMLVAISPRAPALAQRLGVRVVGGAGLALMGIGFLVFTQLDVDSPYWLFGTGALVTGIGLALATSPATTAIVSSLPSHRQGIASAVNDLSREVGGAFGIAILGSVLNSVYRSDMSSATPVCPRRGRCGRGLGRRGHARRRPGRPGRERAAGAGRAGIRERLVDRGARGRRRPVRGEWARGAARTRPRAQSSPANPNAIAERR